MVDRIASAALDQFAEYGIRRSTIDDVAKRAGVSRVTVFRRFTNKEHLVEFVIAREIRRGVHELDRAWEGGDRWRIDWCMDSLSPCGSLAGIHCLGVFCTANPKLSFRW